MKEGKHICTVCNTIYKEEEEEEEEELKCGCNIRFDDLPEDWKCTSCGGDKENYQPCSSSAANQ